MTPLLVAASLFVLTLATPISSQAQLKQWQAGRLLSIEINGQGPDAKSRTKDPAIWWTYCVCAQDRTYYAVMRKSPETAGLTVPIGVKFSTDRNQLYLLNAKGERQVLRIVRQDKRNTCR
jgi:hypothetical protein